MVLSGLPLPYFHSTLECCRISRVESEYLLRSPTCTASGPRTGWTSTRSRNFSLGFFPGQVQHDVRVDVELEEVDVPPPRLEAVLDHVEPDGVVDHDPLVARVRDVRVDPLDRQLVPGVDVLAVGVAVVGVPARHHVERGGEGDHRDHGEPGDLLPEDRVRPEGEDERHQPVGQAGDAEREERQHPDDVHRRHVAAGPQHGQHQDHARDRHRAHVVERQAEQYRDGTRHDQDRVVEQPVVDTE